MLKFKTRTATALAAVAVLAGCASNLPLQRFQGDALRTGESMSSALGKVGQATATLTHTFEWEGKKYEARHFNLQTGSRQEMTMVCSPVCIPIFYNVPVTAPYVVVFQGEPPALVAAGQTEELSRSADNNISGFMPALKAAAQASAKK